MMVKWIVSIVVFMIIAFSPSLVFSQDAASGQPPAGADEEETLLLNLPNELELTVLVQLVSEQLDKDFMYKQEYLQDKRIILLAPQGIAKKDLFKLLESNLEYFGLTLIETETGYKIEQSESIQQKNVPLYMPENKGVIPDTNSIIRMVISLKNVKPEVVKPVVEPFLTANGKVYTVEDSNLLIVTDYATNITPLYRLIETVDVKQPERVFKIFRLKHASADQIIGIIRDLAEQAQDESAPTRSEQSSVIQELQEISTSAPTQIRGETSALTAPKASVEFLGTSALKADTRTNSIIFYGFPEQRDSIALLVDQLDVPQDKKPLRIFRLQHADAEKVAEVLGRIFGEGGASIAAPTTISSEDGTTGGLTGFSSAEVKAVAYTETNSIIITARPEKFSEIEGIIQALDVQRKQVLISAHVLDLSNVDFFDLGVELEFLNIGNFTGGYGITLFGQSSFGAEGGNILTDTRSIAPSTGLNAAFVIDNEKVPFLLSTLQTKTNTKILSMPKALANDNSQAVIKNLRGEPFTQLSQGEVTTVETFGGFQEAGTTLTITPHISEGNQLRLEIEVEVSSFTGTGSNGVPPPKLTDSIVTDVTIPDDSTIIIGGLTSTRLTKTEDKVPLLGDIPIIKYLFSRHTTNQSTSYIYIFISAQIFDSAEFVKLKEYSQEQQDTITSKEKELDLED